MDGFDGDDQALDRVTDVVRALRNLALNDRIPCLDFIDVKVVLDDREAPQRACFGTGLATGPDRAVRAAQAALADLRRHLAETRDVPTPEMRRDVVRSG